VKPLHLNLAARPYRDHGPFTIVASAALAVIALLAYVNIDTYLRYKSETKTTAVKIEQLERQIDEEKNLTESANQRTRSIDVKLLGRQISFANARLAERAFSWSELLDRLEHVLPDDVRILSVSPTFSKEGLVRLNLSCAGKKDDSMLRTLDALIHDARFVAPFPSGETKGEHEYQFIINVDYKPTIMRVLE